MARVRKQKKSHAFLIFYLILVAVLAVIVVRQWRYTWRKAAEYEAFQPHNLVEGILDDYREYADGTLSYKRDYSVTEEGRQVFALLDGDEVFAHVYLKTQDEPGIVGLDLYEIDRVEGARDLEIEAPQMCTVYAGKTAISPEFCTQEGIVPEALLPLQEEDLGLEIPTRVRLEIPKMLRIPEVTAEMENAECVIREENGVFIVDAVPTEAVREELTAFAEEFSRRYSYYISADLAWRDLRSYVLQTAPLYQELSTMEVKWFSPHTGQEVRDLTVGEFAYYTDTLVSLRAAYDYVVIGQGKTTTYPTDYTLFLVKAEDGWKVAAMHIN